MVIHDQRLKERAEAISRIKHELKGNPEALGEILSRYADNPSSYEFKAMKSQVLTEVDQALKQVQNHLEKNRVSEAVRITQTLVQFLHIAQQHKFDLARTETELKESFQTKFLNTERSHGTSIDHGSLHIVK